MCACVLPRVCRTRRDRASSAQTASMWTYKVSFLNQTVTEWGDQEKIHIGSAFFIAQCAENIALNPRQELIGKHLRNHILPLRALVNIMASRILNGICSGALCMSTHAHA